MTGVEARLRQLEQAVLGNTSLTDEDRAHPTGSGCWFCGLSFAVEADDTGRCWFPHAANAPNDTCLGCFLDAHALGFADTEWRDPTEHRDVVVTRLAFDVSGTWEPGTAAGAGWRWFHERYDVEPHPTDRFAWVDVEELRVLADPPEHTCDDGCPPLHADLRDLGSRDRSPGVRFGYKTVGAGESAVGVPVEPVFSRGPHAGQPARFDKKADEWVPA